MAMWLGPRARLRRKVAGLVPGHSTFQNATPSVSRNRWKEGPRRRQTGTAPDDQRATDDSGLRAGTWVSANSAGETGAHPRLLTSQPRPSWD